MTTILSNPRSKFGMTCVQCSDELIAPEWSKYRNERQVHHASRLALHELQRMFWVSGRVSCRNQVNERYQDRQSYLPVAVPVAVGRIGQLKGSRENHSHAVVRAARLSCGASQCL